MIEAGGLQAQAPDWYTQELSRQVGTWIANNADYQSDQETDDAYGVEWSWGVGRMSLLGCLFGMKGGDRTQEYWQFIQYWDPEAQAGKVIQVAAWGSMGEGYMNRTDTGEMRMEQTFTQPDGTVAKHGHITEIHDGYEISKSFNIDKEGVWKDDRTYKWVRESE
jgi:hypothetical protein